MSLFLKCFFLLLVYVSGIVTFQGYFTVTDRDHEKASRIMASQRERRPTSNGSCVYLDMLRESEEVDIYGYRSMLGGYNNMKLPQLGFVGTPFMTSVPRVFSGENNIRKSVTGVDLPNARALSNSFFPRGVVNANFPVTNLITFVGQFLLHDILRSINQEGPDCCAQGVAINNELCSAIEVPEGDPDFSMFDFTCIPQRRSQTGPPIHCESNDTKNLNFNTDWLDLDLVYSDGLRTGVQGLLRVSEVCFNEIGGRVNCNSVEAVTESIFLPKCTNGETGCPFCRPEPPSADNSGDQCCLSNDPRSNQTPMLALLHTLFHRNHNRLAALISSLNKGLHDELVFQEARKWNIALYQNILYKELMPTIIGHQEMKAFKLYPQKSGYFKYYDSAIDGRTSHASNMAFRFGHSMIRKLAVTIDRDGNATRQFMVDVFGACYPLELHAEAMADYYRGTLLNAAAVDDEIGEPMKPTTPVLFIDIISLDIQRGRETGVAPYNRFRHFCRTSNRGAVKSFDDLLVDMSEVNVRKLKSMYASVHDIDLYVGMHLETPLEGALVGPTMACIIGDQMRRLKMGDRFYYENPGQFTGGQLDRVRMVTFEHLVCWNMQPIDMVPVNSFLLDGKLISCSELPSISDILLDKEDVNIN